MSLMSLEQMLDAETEDCYRHACSECAADIPHVTSGIRDCEDHDEETRGLCDDHRDEQRRKAVRARVKRWTRNARRI